MTINVDEKYREIIEQEYGSIIKFKRVFYLRFGMNKESITLINKMLDECTENIINLIQYSWEAMQPIFCSIRNTINEITKYMKEMVDGLKPIFENVEYKKCYFVKEYEKVPLKKYAVTVLHLLMLFHCRNNC